MKLGARGRYAVMAMADLARRSGELPERESVCLSEIAARQEISLAYLEQLFAKLRRGGLVVAIRGPGGGYRLARAASETRIADIIFAVEEPVSRALRTQQLQRRRRTGLPLARAHADRNAVGLVSDDQPRSQCRLRRLLHLRHRR